MLGIYTAVILVVFSLFIPVIDRTIREKKEAVNTEAVNTEIVNTEAETNKAIVPETVINDAVISEPVITDVATAKPAVADITKISWPVKGKIIREFGLTYSLTFNDYRNHNGIDIEAQVNTEVAAVLPGKVLSVRTTEAAANTVIIEHGNGWQSEYAHLEEALLKPGNIVKAGQAIGTIGQPGIYEILEGPHLHFSLYKDSKTVNPLVYLPK